MKVCNKILIEKKTLNLIKTFHRYNFLEILRELIYINLFINSYARNKKKKNLQFKVEQIFIY